MASYDVVNNPFGERDVPQPKKLRVWVVVLLAVVVLGGIFGYAWWDQKQTDQRREQELNEGTCDILVGTGTYGSFEQCMRNR